MARTLTEDGKCFRAGVKYVDKQGQDRVAYFGPYAEPGMAKAMRTRWINRGYHHYIILEKFVEISETWRRI